MFVIVSYNFILCVNVFLLFLGLIPGYISEHSFRVTTQKCKLHAILVSNSLVLYFMACACKSVRKIKPDHKVVLL